MPGFHSHRQALLDAPVRQIDEGQCAFTGQNHERGLAILRERDTAWLIADGNGSLRLQTLRRHGQQGEAICQAIGDDRRFAIAGQGNAERRVTDRRFYDHAP